MSWKGQFLQIANRLLRPIDIEIVHYREHWRPTDLLGPRPFQDAPRLTIESPFLKVFRGRDTDLRDSFDFAVVMPTPLLPDG
jgi:hypothetical protein